MALQTPDTWTIGFSPQSTDFDKISVDLRNPTIDQNKGGTNLANVGDLTFAAGKTITGLSQLGVGTSSPGAGVLADFRATTDQRLTVGSMAWTLTGAVGLNCVNDANNAYIPFALMASQYKMLFPGPYANDAAAAAAGVPVGGLYYGSGNPRPIYQRGA